MVIKKIAVLIFALGIFSSCEKSVYVSPELPDTISFKKHIIPLFNNYCNNQGCHGGQFPEGNLNLESQKAYQQLWDKDMLDTINPVNSLLYSQMNSVNKPMPPVGKLDTFYIKEILRWIEQGARNN